jgi:mono/diheme cytochrome c family protein
MSDEDVRAVVAYLRSIPRVPEPRRRLKNAIPLLVRAFDRVDAVVRMPARHVATPPRSDRVTYGEYVAHLATCADCHSLGKGGPRSTSDRYLAGSDVPMPEAGLVWAPNITPDTDTGIGSHSREQVKRALRDGVRLDGAKMAPPMATYSHHYAGMTDDDLDALVTYLFAQRPVRQPVPPRKLSPAMQARIGGPASPAIFDRPKR